MALANKILALIAIGLPDKQGIPRFESDSLKELARFANRLVGRDVGDGQLARRGLGRRQAARRKPRQDEQRDRYRAE